MVQGLVEKWQYPFFCEFDCKITKDLYMQLICTLEDAGLEVVSSTCDQGGSNYGLISELGIEDDAPWVQNPRRPDYFVFFNFDWVHVHKNLRNNLLDHILVLLNGLKINAKQELRQLFKHCRDNEVSSGSFLKDIFLDCKSSDRQTVKFAEELMSNKVAALLRQFFPNDAKKSALADIFDMIHNGCHIHSFQLFVYFSQLFVYLFLLFLLFSLLQS